MVWIYDVETFANLFSVTAKSMDGAQTKQFLIHQEVNQLEEIIHFFTRNSSDWFVGYNSTSFDDPLIEYIIQKKDLLGRWDCDAITGHLVVKASDIIDDKYSRYKKVSFNRFDLMRIAGLYKSLKLVAVNLKHDLIQDLPFKFSDKIQIDQVQKVLDYNENDVEITYKLYHNLRKKIKLRQELTGEYGINLMNQSRSGIANKILEQDYAKRSGMHPSEFKNINTVRNSVDFSEIISDKIYFNSDNLKKLLRDIKSTTAGVDDKIVFHAMVGNTRYDIAKGGIHSDMPPEIFQSTDSVTIKDADVSSYYPNIMINLGIKPEHLHDCFLPLLKSYTDRRIIAKKKGDVTASDGLKIVINSIYGKMGFEHHWLYDLKALYQTTLNGQLFLLMLIEWLEKAGIEVIYANTDGITAKVHNNMTETYHQICQKWQQYTGFDLDFDNYQKCIIKDVNNYIWIPQDEDKDIKYKGFFDINRWEDVTKSFDKPIVPLAVYKYFVEDEPVEKTITECEDILDFCMAQKVGSKFEVFHQFMDNRELVTDKLQDTNRYYVGKGGGRVYKQEPGSSKQTSLIANEPTWVLNDMSSSDASQYPVKHSYYIREAYKTIDLFNSKQTDLFA